MSAQFESLGTLLSRHLAITRVSLAVLSFTLVIAFSQQAATTQAGPEPAPVVPESLLPQTVGVAVATDDAITIPFDATMDTASVEAAVQVLPQQSFELAWNEDRSQLSISPERRWRTDESYLIVVAGSGADADGAPITNAQRYAFTTQTAPAVSDFQVKLADPADPAEALDSDVAALSIDEPPDPEEAGQQPPTETAHDVSAGTEITVSFSAAMDRADVERHFLISPAVEGDLGWVGGDLVFTPSGRLDPGSRYTISVIGAHDRAGNVLGGKANFSFTVMPGAQLTKTDPGLGAKGVQPETVVMWFSQPMDIGATNDALVVTDTDEGSAVAGKLSWNDAATQVTFTPDAAFAAGHRFEVAVGDGARDADGNAIAQEWWFSTKAEAAPVAAPPAQEPASRSTTSTRSAPAAPPPPPPSAPSPPPAAPATSLAGHALNQVNAARAAYGFAPVVLDARISAVASAHAWDQATNGYFSHFGLNGSSRESRLAAGGVSFSWSGENQCYHIGMSQQATLDWCHKQFMAEPYPGHWNHIANILNPNAKRMGVGIATVNGRTVITWNFTN